MSDRIELTEAEREAAAEAAYIQHELAVRGDGGWLRWEKIGRNQTMWHQAINSAVSAINEVRAGDPVGTIRRRPWPVNIALRVDEKTCPWRILDPDRPDKVILAEHRIVDSWPVIYSPEEPA